MKTLYINIPICSVLIEFSVCNKSTLMFLQQPEPGSVTRILLVRVKLEQQLRNITSV